MSDANKKKENKRVGRWIGMGVAIVVFAMVVLVLMWSEDTAQVTRIDTVAGVQPVSVSTIHAETARAEIAVFAEVRPQWVADIRAAVPGRIIEVSLDALAGTRVEEGASLIQIERSPYVAAVASAELAVEEAELNRLTAQNHVTVARRQFERDGREPPNELALRLPQLRIAEYHLEAAQAHLSSARQQLSDTHIRAPFSGFITARMVSPGQSVSAGEPLLSLADNQRFELSAELSQAEWALLDQPIEGSEVDLFHRNGFRAGSARVRQGGGYLDPDTRQMRVFLEITNPPETILAGDFLRVVFGGRAIPDNLVIPEAAITREGHVWFVDDDNLLQRVEPEILFRAGDQVAIAALDDGGPWRIAVTPLASFLPGQQVSPVESEG
jgi:multidrug efflux system membrane fusion protein